MLFFSKYVKFNASLFNLLIRITFSKTVVDHYRENACEKILERFQRDLGALVDSQALERRTTLTQMKQNGSSNTQLQASRYEEYSSFFHLTWNHHTLLF